MRITSKGQVTMPVTSREQALDITRRYQALCAHYGMIPSRNNPGEAHENGAALAHHRHLKTALDQALILRGSGDFASLAEYRRFVDQLVGRRNGRRRDALGATHVVSHPRVRSRGGGRRLHVVDYRHVIHALKRKPQALAGSVYRDGLFPRSEYAQAWQALTAALPQRDACRRMVALLALAHEEACEAELARLIEGELTALVSFDGLLEARP